MFLLLMAAEVHQVNGHWVCGNGQLSAADVGRVQWQRPNGERPLGERGCCRKVITYASVLGRNTHVPPILMFTRGTGF